MMEQAHEQKWNRKAQANQRGHGTDTGHVRRTESGRIGMCCIIKYSDIVAWLYGLEIAICVTCA